MGLTEKIQEFTETRRIKTTFNDSFTIGFSMMFEPSRAPPSSLRRILHSLSDHLRLYLLHLSSPKNTGVSAKYETLKWGCERNLK